MKRQRGGAVVACLIFLGMSPALGLAVSAPEAPISTEDLTLSLGFSVTTIAGVEAVVGSSGGFLEGSAIVNQTLIGNRVVEPNFTSRALIQDAFHDNQGILGVNQSSDDMVNQANVVSFSLTDSRTAFAEAQAAVDQAIIANWVEEQNVTRHALIQDAFQDNQGILSVNQAAGNLTNQANVRVLTLGPVDTPVQGLDLAKSARSLDNTLISSGGERETRISNSFGGTVGIVGANQSAGNLNQQANVLVLGLGAALGPEVVALGDATLGEISARNTVKQEGPAGPRADILTDSFAGFRGIAQVNQSAGDLNHMGNFVGLSLTVLTLP